MLGTIFLHHVRQLMVHVIFNTGCSFFFLRRFFTNNLSTHRPRSGECLHDSLGLKLNRTLHQQGVGHTTRTGPRLTTLFVLQPQQFQAFNICIQPVFTRGEVGVIVTKQVTSKGLQLLSRHLFSQISVEVFGVAVFFHAYFYAVGVYGHRFRVFNFNLNFRFFCRCNPLRRFIQ